MNEEVKIPSYLPSTVSALEIYINYCEKEVNKWRKKIKEASLAIELKKNGKIQN